MLPKCDLDLKIKIWSLFSKIRLFIFEKKRLKQGRFRYKNDQMRWISAYNFGSISAYRFKVVTYKKRRDIICPLYLGKLLSI